MPARMSKHYRERDRFYACLICWHALECGVDKEPVMTEPAEKDLMRADRASKGGEARMRKLSKHERATLATKAARARWKKSVPGENASKEFQSNCLVC